MEAFASVVAIVLVLLVGVVSPGPSFLFIAQRSMSHSRRDGVLASLGMGVGGVVFAVLALLGIQALFSIFPMVYGGLKVLGGGYLLYLAWKIWKGARSPLIVGAQETSTTTSRSFWLGLVAQVSNPKTMVVYASVLSSLLPVRVDGAFVAMLLPLVFLVEAGWYTVVAVSLSSSRPRDLYLKAKKTIDVTAGTLLGVLGLKMIFDNELLH